MQSRCHRVICSKAARLCAGRGGPTVNRLTGHDRFSWISSPSMLAQKKELRDRSRNAPGHSHNIDLFTPARRSSRSRVRRLQAASAWARNTGVPTSRSRAHPGMTVPEAGAIERLPSPTLDPARAGLFVSPSRQVADGARGEAPKFFVAWRMVSTLVGSYLRANRAGAVEQRLA